MSWQGMAMTQQQQRQQPATGDEGVGREPHVAVEGCAHGTVGGIIRGNFAPSCENHGRPAYKRSEQVNGLDVMIYYWDERDGAGFNGWWFGPSIGGDQVWAYHPGKHIQTPPRRGWKVPYDGPIDASIVLTGSKTKAATPAGAGGGGYSQGNTRNQPGQDRRGAEHHSGKPAASSRPQVQIEELKRKAIEFRQKQEEDRNRKTEELKAKQEEQRSVFAIRRVLQKVRVCTLDNFEEIVKELEEVTAKELPKCGSQAVGVGAESEKGVAAARERVDAIREARAKEAERKAESERMDKEMQEKADALVSDFKELVEGAEGVFKELTEETDSLETKAVSEAKLEDAVKSLESSTDQAIQTAKACQAFITEHAPVFKGQKSLSGKAEVAKLMLRVNTCKKDIDLLSTKQDAVKKRAVKRVKASKLTESLDAIFKRSDKDKDGCLSKAEIKGYCKLNHSFTVPSDIIDDIFDNLLEAGTKGVKRDKFQRLRVMVGIARELAMDNARRRLREAKEAELKKAEDAFLATVADYVSELESAEKAAEEADQHCKRLGTVAFKAFKTTSSNEMRELLEKGEALNTAAEEAHVSVKEALPKLGEIEQAEQLQKVITKSVMPLQGRLGLLLKKLQSCTGAVDRFQKTLHEKVKHELAELKKQCLELLRNHKAANHLSNEALFKDINTKQDGKIDCSEFVKFMPTCEQKKRMRKSTAASAIGTKPKEKVDQKKGGKEETKDEKEEGAKDPDKTEEAKEDGDKKEDDKEKEDEYEDIELPLPEQEELERCFRHLEASEPELNLEAFERLMRLCMRVTKETVCTEDLEISSKTLRRLELGEVVEVLEGPVAAKDVSVERVRARLVKDMQEAWVTMTGNQGTVFLTPGGDRFKIVKETLLTAAFELDDSSGDDRKLKMGEIVEVIEWPRKGDSSSLTRMRCRATKDGKVGWATTVGNTGNVFLQAI